MRVGPLAIAIIFPSIGFFAGLLLGFGLSMTGALLGDVADR